MANMDKVIIIGGGLSGLTLAYLLQKQGRAAVILEASPRLGGRIQTIKGSLGTPMELGATWFADKHQNLTALVDELGLSKFPQFTKGISLFQTHSSEASQQFSVPEGEAPSYRVAGGTAMLTNTLAQQLSSTDIRLNSVVVEVAETVGGIMVTMADGTTLQGSNAVVCIPPQLAASHIQFTPALPQTMQSLLPQVQTWMAGAIKFTVEYAQPFWRQKGFSGMLYSHSGIVVEMYDHSNFEADCFGFTGFLHGAAAQYDTATRQAYVIKQLTGLLGVEAGQPTAYFDKVWTDAYVQGDNPIIQQPHQHNGHPILHAAYLNGKLLFGATETGSAFPGYMEGAIEAATRVAKYLL